MSYLVDTHYLLWTLMEPDRIDGPTRTVLRSSDHVKHVSAVSFWEISLKYALGRLELKGTSPEKLLQTAMGSGFELLSLEGEVVASSHRLPAIANHKDPFDRLLVWQCIRADLTMLSADERFKDYEQYGLKLLA